MDLDESIHRWKERMFLARDQMLNDPTTAREWQRGVVREIEEALAQEACAQDHEARARLEGLLAKERTALRRTEQECQLWLMQSVWRSRQFHLHQEDALHRSVASLRRPATA